MSIVKMKKLALAGLGSEREELLKKLQKLGCVELRASEAPEGYLSPILGGSGTDRLSQLRAMQKDAETALQYLKT